MSMKKLTPIISVYHNFWLRIMLVILKRRLIRNSKVEGEGG